MSYIYIASPYTDPDPTVRHKRYVAASYYTVKLLIDKQFPYSPVVANHHLAIEFDLKGDTNSWMAYNFAMLRSAAALHVLQLDGWERSTGVLAEINFWRAARQGEPIIWVDPMQLGTASPNSRRRKTIRGDVKCVPALKDG